MVDLLQPVNSQQRQRIKQASKAIVGSVHAFGGLSSGSHV